MGGLVAKKACILGQNDPQYKGVIESIRAIVFLSTPHRGTNLAETLNRILSVSLFNHSPKQYIAELNRNSPAIHDVNEQFKNIAPRLELASLYETQPTPIGPRKIVVLEKDSSILGYPMEISKALDADHHNVCKYTSTQDPNYVSVRNILRSLLGRFQSRTALGGNTPPTHTSLEEARHFKTNHSEEVLIRGLPSEIINLLATTEPPNDDYDFFRGRWMPGSCDWILEDHMFDCWVKAHDSQPWALWIHGVPGAGKSILSSYIVHHLRNIGKSCQYFFFRFEDKSKRSPNTFLRSMAFQIASQWPEYKQLLSKLADETGSLEKVDTRILWQKLYLSRLLKLQAPRPLYWIIDAVDECDAPQQLLVLLSALSVEPMPIRIMFVGRKTQDLSLAFARMGKSIKVEEISMDRSQEDLERYVMKEMEYMRGQENFKARISEKILAGANGNFLWVTLVLNDISQCYTEATIEETLEEMPAELEPLYQRMELSLASASRARDRGLIKAILTYATCSRRPLTVEELAQALRSEFPDIIDLEHTAVKLCGGFVMIDNKLQVVMVHQTAREYLVKTSKLYYSVLPYVAHREIFNRCLASLSSSNYRPRADLLSVPPFMLYAATSWSYHLAASAASADHLQLVLLAKFFQTPSVLVWIHLLATHGQLRFLLYASQSITSYLKKQALIDAERSPMTHRLDERELVELWAVDLVKIVGKFGPNLMQHPRSIYSLIPTFCPTNSMISRQFCSNKAKTTLTISGFASTQWDDSLAKFPASKRGRPTKMVCSEKYFAILTSDGNLSLYQAATCEILRRFTHGERVLCFCFGDSWRKLVTYGFLTTKIWDVQSGRQEHSFRNPSGAKAQAVSYLQDKNVVISCSDDRGIRQAVLDDGNAKWAIIEPSPGGDGYDGKQYNSPRRVTISADGQQVAIAYRGFPLLVWGVDPPGLVGRCERLTDKSKNRHDLWTDVGPICWNPVSGHILGLYNDGCIFKWHPIEQDNQELKTVAADIQCSPSGNIFVTSNVDGSLCIWSFQHFVLIYSLSCHTPVSDLTISPDERRIYDLRESFCNVWEPNALIRLAETDDGATDTSSTLDGFSQAAEAVIEMSDPITAFAVSPQNSSYCIGDESGSLRLHKCGESSSTEITRTFMPVDYATWSDDGTILVTADLGAKLSVWTVDPQEPGKKPVLSFDAKITSIRQIVISHDSQHIFVAVQGFVQVWSLSQKSLLTSQICSSEACRWVQHPQYDDVLLRIDLGRIIVMQWPKLTELRSFAFNDPTFDAESLAFDSIDINPMSPGEEANHVDEIFCTSDGSQILVQTSETSGDRKRRRKLMLFSVSELDGNNRTIKPRQLPPSIATHVGLSLGFVSRDRRRPSFAAEAVSEDLLIFFDKESWICSWALGDIEAVAPKRHFFLPQDWLNAECFRFATVSRDGMLFAPRNGEVAVIRNGFREEWVE